jgi:AcrR family transcriptional regulator
MTAPHRSSPSAPPHYVQVAWTLRDLDPDAAGQGLNAHKLVRAGIELADQDGLAGLSIRKLQRQLGFTAMALYRHVRSRSELVLLMADVALGAPPAVSINESIWKEAVRAWGRGLFARYQAHPWLLDVPVFSLPVTPNHILWVEFFLACVATSPLTLQRKLDAALLIDGHARHIAHLQRLGEERVAESPEPPAWLRSVIDRTAHPFFSAVLDEGVLGDATGPDFEFGLDCIIDGLAARGHS